MCASASVPELDALRFNPFNCGGGMRPSGVFNRWRAAAYPLSQAAWRRTERDGAERQDAAEARLRALDRSPDRPMQPVRLN